MNIDNIKRQYSEKDIDKVLDEIYDNIDKHNYNDFISVSKNLAYEESYNAMNRLKNKKTLSCIDGVPIAIKDNIAVKDIRMTCASRILEDYISPFDATIVKRIKDAGGIIIGKTNLDEFAMGSSTENSYFKMTKNPIALDRVPGGSSGGSAASIAAKHAVVALGSDTGGSVRQPAAFCNVVGFKPSYGVISRYGLTAFSSSLDTIGIMANNVKDVNTVFNIIKGKDQYDSTLVEISLMEDISNRIGVIENIEGLDENILKLYKHKVNILKNNNFEIINIDIKSLKQSIAVYQIISMCEASSNLARYDGIKYGLQIDKANSMFEIYSKIRGMGFGKEVKRRIMTGTYFLSYKNGYFYKMARRARVKIENEIKAIFNNIDYIILPTTLSLPFKPNERMKDPLLMHLSDSLTSFCNLANVPAISVPAGFVLNLPVGLQIISKTYSDLNLLKTAELIEKIWSDYE